MKFIFNDLPFNYSFENEYTIRVAVEKFADVIVEIQNARKEIQLLYEGDINGQDLMPGYTIPQLYNDRGIRQDKKRVIIRFLTKMQNVNVEQEQEFIFDGNKSKLCGYAIKRNLPAISLQINDKFSLPIIIGSNNYDEEIQLKNIAEPVHVFIHSSILNIRIYELNPKHKIGHNWGSPMDLDDETAQKILDTAIIYENDDKCLINYYKGKYYVFRRHINNCYHGYINNGVPENIKRKFSDAK
ncbi:MAG: hypothetical protein Q4F83_12570 [Eubacteriales bacterium]|nr:hypothetical protein [Eubacteriales bacterium]